MMLKSNLVVRTAAEASALAAVAQANATLANRLTINAPADVAKGENFLISITEGINQTPIEEAEASLTRRTSATQASKGL